MSVPFRARNPVIIGAVSLAVITVLILGAFRAQDLPLIGGGDTYYAAFSESGGLKANDEVRIAGVRVGKVESVELDGDHVKVTFRVKTDSAFGARDRGRDPDQDAARGDVPRPAAGRLGPARAGAEIPRSRTTSPYDVVEAFSGLAETSEQIDTDQLAKSLHDAGRPDPQHPRGVPRRPRRRVARSPRTSPRATRRSTRCSRTSSGSRRSSTTATRTSSR